MMDLEQSKLLAMAIIARGPERTATSVFVRLGKGTKEVSEKFDFWFGFD